MRELFTNYDFKSEHNHYFDVSLIDYREIDRMEQKLKLSLQKDVTVQKEIIKQNFQKIHNLLKKLYKT
jgi:hypothetical protein